MNPKAVEMDKAAAVARRNAAVAVPILSLYRPAVVKQMDDEQNVSETERIWRELSDRLRQFIQQAYLSAQQHWLTCKIDLRETTFGERFFS